ncbi:MAG: hypothetical protein JSW50_07470 [Candidatus Latescibacterota bacterium]|nr:MAG: hypothetical protein JSW50_07470 [Candidatus Latescibacterota bacterium]
MLKKGIVLTAVLLVTSLGAPQAQSLWLDKKVRHSIAGEVFFPKFRDIDSPNAEIMTLFVTGSIALSDKVALVIEVPYIRNNFEIVTDYFEYGFLPYQLDISVNQFGNPYIGIAGKSVDESVLIEAGFRIPLTNDEFGLALAALSDVQRIDAYEPDHFVAKLLINVRKKVLSDFGLQIRTGPALWIRQSDFYYWQDKFEFLIHYAAGGFFERSGLAIGALVHGVVATDSKASFFGTGKSSINLIDVGANYDIGESQGKKLLRVGARASFPLGEEYTDIADVIFGFDVTLHKP